MKTIEEEFLQSLQDKNNCPNCARAQAHAVRHNGDMAGIGYVSCRAHRVIDAYASRFLKIEWVNPANTSGFTVTSGQPWSLDTLDEWVIIAASPVSVHRDENEATVVTVAAVENGEYVARHHAVLVATKEGITLLHDTHAVEAVAIATAMIGGYVINTCTYGDAGDTPARPHSPVQRDRCVECSPDDFPVIKVFCPLCGHEGDGRDGEKCPSPGCEGKMEENSTITYA